MSVNFDGFASLATALANQQTRKADQQTQLNKLLLEDPNQRGPYADRTSAFLDDAAANWQQNPAQYRSALVTKADELDQVLKSTNWDAVDPVFKHMLEERLQRTNDLRTTIESAHPELLDDGSGGGYTAG